MLNKAIAASMNTRIIRCIGLWTATLTVSLTANWLYSASPPVADIQSVPNTHAPLLKPAWQPDMDQIQLTKDVVAILDEKHFSKITLDDRLSSQLLDNYLDMLDPNRHIFLKADIDDFEQYRTRFDDELEEARLDAAGAIYQRYHNRLVSRLNWAIEAIPRLVADQQISPDAVIEVKREGKPWPTTTAESDQLWEANLRESILALQLSDKAGKDIEVTLTRRYNNQLKRLAKMTPMDNFEVYMNAFTELYDPHTNFMAPKTSDNFDISMTLSLDGIGAVLEREDEFTKITRLIPGGPAAKQAELKSGDRILAISQGQASETWEDVVGWRLDEVVQLIRGQAKTWVRLQVQRGDAEIKTIAIKREKVKLEDQAASKNIIEVTDEDGEKFKVGIITVPSFYLDFEALRRKDPNTRSTTRDVLRLLREMQNERIDGLIVDLRDNGGGSLLEANQLTDLFIDQGPVVQILEADQDIDLRNRAVNPMYYKGPMVVLVNHLSASASEIFSGAIQDYKRGIVVGEQTFGKGTVQSLVDLYVGKIKITESKFYRVSGDSTQHRGVIPDITYPSLLPFDEVGESALDHAMPWDAIPATPHITYPMQANLIPKLNREHMARMEKSTEYKALLDQKVFIEEQRKRTTLPLDRTKRTAMKKQDEQRLLDIVNAVRAERSLPLFTKMSEIEDENRRKRDDKNPDDDFLLKESGQIMVDYIQSMTAKAALAGPASN